MIYLNTRGSAVPTERQKTVIIDRKPNREYESNLQQNFTIKELPNTERPRERLIEYGPQSLSNAELLAIILRTGTKKSNVIDLAKRLLINYDLKSLSRLSIGDLKKNIGIGKAKACQIIASFELGRRIASNNNDNKPTMDNPEAVGKYFLPHIQILRQESFYCVYLNSKNWLLKSLLISTGGLNTNIVEPREIFRGAISENAAAIIFVHNHPSGDPTPSKEDIEFTKKLMSAGNIMGIKVLDHVIIGDGKWLSLKEKNFI